MKIYNMPAKKFEPAEFDKRLATFHHLVLFDSPAELRSAISSAHNWVGAVIEIKDISDDAYGQIAICSTEKHHAEFFFRCDGLSEKEVIEKFLDIVEAKEKKSKGRKYL